jgi:hypothetical protein
VNFPKFLGIVQSFMVVLCSAEHGTFLLWGFISIAGVCDFFFVQVLDCVVCFVLVHLYYLVIGQSKLKGVR